MFGQVSSMFPHANPMDVSVLSGLTPQQTAALRGNERDQFLNLKAQAIGMPGATSAWGQGLQQIGGTVAGIGAMGMFSGGGSQSGGHLGGGQFAPGTSTSDLYSFYNP
jgi:hypothetical protein